MLPAITESVGNGIDTWQSQERHGATPIKSTTDDHYLTPNVPRLRPRPSNRVRMAKRRDPSGNPLVGLRLLGLARRGHLRGDGRRLPSVELPLNRCRRPIIDSDPGLVTLLLVFTQKVRVIKNLLPHL